MRVKTSPENQQPECGLHHAREQFDGIVNQFADVGFGDGQGLPHKLSSRENISRDAWWCFLYVLHL